MSNIIIQDWAGNILFQGDHESPDVDRVLDANRCNCDDECQACDGTGYKSEIWVYWADQTDERNVYEFINF